MFAYFIIIQTCKSISERVILSESSPLLLLRGDFSFRLFISRSRTSWQRTREHFSSSDYRATVSDYALAHFTYRNPKPPFSSDRRPWSSRRISRREKARPLSFFSLCLLIDWEINWKRETFFCIGLKRQGANPTTAIRILHRIIRALSSSFVPFLKLSDRL